MVVKSVKIKNPEMPTATKTGVARFGSFELNLKSGELRRSGIRLRLPDQVFQILSLLLENQGELVSREELRLRLWKQDTFVDFERGLNRAINKLRETLCDSAETPRYIETIPRRGYRFIAPVLPDHTVQQNGAASDVPSSLVIIPFSNVSGSAEAEVLCAGLAESLIYRFGELPLLRVMAFTTALRYRNSPNDAQSVGRELGVDAVLTGRVSLHGDLLKIGAELVDVHDGSLLWGHQYDRALTDWFDVQEDMSRAIFESLRLTLTQQEIKRVQKRQTSSIEAHQFYIRGMFQFGMRELHSMRRAMEYFQKAQEVDPEYALAYSGLASCFALFSLYPYCFASPLEAMPRARAAAMSALALDPGLAEAHAILGLVSLAYDWHFDESETHFRRAIELKPNYGPVHIWYAIHCIATGQFEQAHAEAQMVRDLDPLSAIGFAMPAITLYYDRQFERALEKIKPVATFEPSYHLVHLFIGYGECALGRATRAIEAFQTALRLCSAESPSIAALSRLGYAYGLAGETAKAEEVLQRLEKIAQERFVPAHAPTFVNLGLNRIEAVLAGVEEMLHERSDYLIYLPHHAAFDVVRQEPRFIAAMDEAYGRRALAARK